jgi:acyl-CoA reductase-like NAD-dependent aldehyde dehydrogenase
VVRERILDQVSALRVGDPLASGTQMGPVVSQAQLARVCGYVDSGVAQGATLLHGGRRLPWAGYFVEPAVFVDTTPQMRIVREEIFGPVVALRAFDTEREAVEIAHDTDYGLSASVWTRDSGRVHRLAETLRVGTVWVNCFGEMDVALPFGGFKLSGVGREQGPESIDEFTETKAVFVRS